MSLLQNLDLPIIAAPMAGGPSTPELVRAVADTGGLGFLATGTYSVEETEQRIAECGEFYGVNLFAKQTPLESVDPVRKFIDDVGLDVDSLPTVDFSNRWDQKLDVLLAAEPRPAVVSSTFGPFSAEEIDRLHDAGVEAWITVTNPEDAATAEKLGADALVVQGPEAGGHRGTWDIYTEPDTRPLMELLDAVEVSIPVVAAGGINESNIQAFLAKADAVSLGSAFLLAEEAGTNEFNRQLLMEGGTSVSTRGFSGRYARGLETEFTRTHDVAPIYPYVNPLLKSKRRELAYAYCLVGVDWPTETEKATDIVDRLRAAL